MTKHKINYLKFTKREHEVLKLVVQGFNNKEIAQMLGITKNTSKAHVDSLALKVAARNRAHLCYIIAHTGFRL